MSSSYPLPERCLGGQARKSSGPDKKKKNTKTTKERKAKQNGKKEKSRDFVRLTELVFLDPIVSTANRARAIEKENQRLARQRQNDTKNQMEGERGGYLSEWADRRSRGAFNDLCRSTKPRANPK